MRKIFLILFLSALTLAWGGMAIMADWTPEDGFGGMECKSDQSDCSCG
jgi:hypothetical protein